MLVGSESCGPCNQAAAWLDARGVAFRKASITHDAELQAWLKEATGQRTVPQFFFDGQWIRGGFADVQRLVEQGLIASARITQERPG